MLAVSVVAALVAVAVVLLALLAFDELEDEAAELVALETDADSVTALVEELEAALELLAELVALLELAALLAEELAAEEDDELALELLLELAELLDELAADEATSVLLVASDVVVLSALADRVPAPNNEKDANAAKTQVFPTLYILYRNLGSPLKALFRMNFTFNRPP